MALPCSSYGRESGTTERGALRGERRRRRVEQQQAESGQQQRHLGQRMSSDKHRRVAAYCLSPYWCAIEPARRSLACKDDEEGEPVKVNRATLPLSTL